MDRLLMMFAQLQELLEEERGALLAGEPERITAIALQKRALADAIEAEAAAQSLNEQPDREQLRRLARYNRENSVICSAMLRHMIEAIDKLHRYEPHRSYRADGSERAQTVRNTLGAA